MLKTIGLFDKPALSKNDSSRLASSRDDNSKPASKEKNSASEVNRFDGDGVKYSKNSEKLKSQKLVKSKKLSKSENLPYFTITEVRQNFLTSDAR